MSDIRKHAVESLGRLHLRSADDQPLYADDQKDKPMVVNVYGPGSKQYAKAQAAQNNRFVDRLKKKGKTDQTAEQKAAEVAEFLTDCTQSFENVEYDQFTGRELAKAIYEDVSIGFIADQVSKFIGDWQNFLPTSSTS